MSEAEALLNGKRGLIMGVANGKSLAWGIAREAARHGAELAFTFQGEALEKRVRPLAAEVGSDLVLSCDVTDDKSIDAVFDFLKERWGTLDFLVHAIGFSDKNELRGRYIDTSVDNFLMTMNISCYSFTAVARRAEALMEDGGAMLTLSYAGSERVVPHYNVMGLAKAALESSVKYLAYDLGVKNIRVNAISAGPVRTLSASGITDFLDLLHNAATYSALKRNITPQEIANTACFLASSLSSGITGQILYVDGGFNIFA